MNKSLPPLSEESANLLQHLETRFNTIDQRFDSVDKGFDVLDNKVSTLAESVTDLRETVEFMKETMVTKDEFTSIATKQELYRSHDALVKRIERHEKLGTQAHR